MPTSEFQLTYLFTNVVLPTATSPMSMTLRGRNFNFGCHCDSKRTALEKSFTSAKGETASL